MARREGSAQGEVVQRRQRDVALRGIGATHRGDIARATIEGMAFELRLLLEALERYTGREIREIVAVGGGARNTVWTQIKADVTGRRIVT